MTHRLLARRWSMACLPLVLLIVAFSSPSVSGQTPDPRPVSQENMRQALAVAKLAASNNLPELSFRAAKGALQGGPPIIPLKFQPGQLSAFNNNTQDATYEQYINEVYNLVTQLVGIWENKDFDKVAIYETLAMVVLPEGRPDEIFLYPQVEKTTNNGRVTEAAPTGSSLARRLTEWAIRAEKVDDLLTRVRARSEKPRAKLDAKLLLIGIAIERGQNENLAQDLDGLRQTILSSGSRSQCEAAGLMALQALPHLTLKQSAAEILEAATQKMAPSGQGNESLEPTMSWLKAAAIARLELGQIEEARQDFQSLLAANDAFYARYDANYSAQMRKQAIERISGELLKRHHLVEAFRFLNQEADPTAVTSALASPTLAAHLARQLKPLSVQDRYDFLMKWSFPPSVGAGFRQLTGFVPTERPPGEFLAALPASWQPFQFDILKTTPQPAVFHSGVALLDAADKLGKRAELISRLEEMAAKNDAGAKAVLLIHRLRGAEASQQSDALLARVAALEDGNLAQPKSGETLKAMPSDDFVAALYALEHPETQVAGQRLIAACLLHAKRLQQPGPRTHLWAATVDALRRQDPAATSAEGAVTSLQNWKPVGYEPAATLDNGIDQNWWFAADGVVKNLVSQSESALMFRYPLTGNFQFSAEVSEGDWSEGALLYGGLRLESYRYRNQIQLGAIGRSGHLTGSGELLKEASTPNELAIQVDGSQTQYSINGYPVFTQETGQSSPWLGLRSTVGWTPSYRGLRITGEPVIPREVPLLENSRLLGWVSSYYAESAPWAVGEEFGTPLANQAKNWSYQQNELRGNRRTVSGSTGEQSVTQSLLYYQRPLWADEQVAYEFYYEPGVAMVHPVLDRLAFLVTPQDVQLHWLTEGKHDWLGLSVDNSAADPAGQRHAGSLPLKVKDWNQMVVAIKDQSVTLTLNGTEIYQRSLPEQATNRFGFYHHRERETARVRNAVLTGQWPEKLPPEVLANLLAPSQPSTPGQQRIARQLIGEETISRDALQVVRTAKSLPAEDRWTFLLNWVFPQQAQVPIRLHADFAPQGDDLGTGQLTPLVSPALLLVQTAKELQRLPQLAEQTTALLAEPESYGARARLALLSLIAAAEGQSTAAEEHLKALQTVLPTVSTKTEWERWPEVVAAGQTVAHPETRLSAVRLLDYLVIEQIQKSQSSGWKFDSQIRWLRGFARGLTTASPEEIVAGVSSRDWIAVNHGSAMVEAAGIPAPYWVRTPAGFQKLAGQEHDFLYYRSPLQGDFTVECELGSFNYRDTALMYAGNRAALSYRRNEANVGKFVTNLPMAKLPQVVASTSGAIPYRLTVSQNKMTIQANGQTIYESALPEHRDPWLAIHTHVNTVGDVRHLRITGNPTIPDEIDLTANETLDGWLAHYYRETVQPTTNARWNRKDAEIVGATEKLLTNTGRESLLQYHRPLIEDGELTYEFYYAPGQFTAHPALGNLAFQLQPEGVQLHQLTAGPWENGGRDAWNAQPVEPAEPLSLQEKAFNTVTIKLQDQTVSLTLNGESIYQGDLPAGNNRLFGLFYRPGESGLRVKNVRYRGDWPKQLPTAEQQEIAQVSPEWLKTDSTRLPGHLVQNFAEQQEISPDFPVRVQSPKEWFRPTPEGLEMTCIGGEGWNESYVSIHRKLVGDFDIEVAYDDLKCDELPAGSVNANIGFMVAPQTPLVNATRASRRISTPARDSVEAVVSYDNLSGKRTYESRELEGGTSAGRIRLIRRGTLIHAFHQPDGQAWHYLETTRLGVSQPISVAYFNASMNNAPGKKVQVRLKSMQVHAEKLDPK